MADIQRTVEIIFGAIDNTGAGISSVSGSLNSIIDATSNITGPLSDVADFALKAEAAVLAVGAAFLTVAVNEASQFTSKVKEIGTLVNATPQEFEALKVSIQDFALTSTSGFDAITKAVYIATSNLGDTAKAMDILTIAEKGAVAGATDIESATAVLTRTMNAYGLVTNDSATNTANADRVMAALFTTVQVGDINMTQLSENLGKVASTAAAAGIPIEVVGAAVAALTGAGINADQSMTLLSSLFKELLNPTDNLKAALGGLTITSDGLPAVLDKLKASTGGSAEQLFQLFGSSEAAKGAMILVNDSAGKFDLTLEKMKTSAQDFNTNYQAMIDTVKNSEQILANTATVLLQKVGDPLQQGWSEILDGLSSVLSGFTLSVDEGAFAPVFTAFDGFSADIAAVLKGIGENLPVALEQVDFSGFLESLAELGFEIGDLFGNVDLSTPEGLAKAIQFVVDSLSSLTTVASGIVDVWGPVVKGFLLGIDAFNGLDDSAKKTFGEVTGLAQVFETLKGSLTGGLDALDTIGKTLTVIAGTNAISALTPLAATLGTVTASALPLVTALTAVAIGVGGLAFGITANINAWDDYKARQNAVADSTARLTDTQADIKIRLEEISRSTGIAVNSMDELNKAVDDGRLVFNEATGAYEAAGTGVRDYDAEVSAASKGGFDFAAAVNGVAATLGLAGKAAGETSLSFSTLAEAEAAYANSTEFGNNATITYSKGLYILSNGNIAAADSTEKLESATKKSAEAAIVGSEQWKRMQDVMLQTQQQTDDFTIKIGELANKKYEIDVKAIVDLKTAEIEADTQRITAALQASSETIKTLTTGVTDLWAAFAGNTGSLSKRFALEDAAKRMEDRLDLELELKREQTEAIVDKLRAETARLDSGEPLISIDAGELAPELELVFDKILKYTQVKATQQGLALLVGL